MIEFLKKNWKVISVGIAGIIIGFLLNIYANKLSEQHIIDTLTAEIESLKEKKTMGRITAQEQQRLIEAQAQLNLLKL